jgi:hypothetical protein
VEESVYFEMRGKMTRFQTLAGGNPNKVNPKLTALKVELAQLETSIEKLLNTLMGANPTMMTCANGRIEEFDG